MTESAERMLPLYEGKMIHHYDHRWATYEPNGSIRDVTASEKADPAFHALPRYWVREVLVRDRLLGPWNRDWLLGWRDICRSTDERTMISCRFPLAAVGHTMPIASTGPDPTALQCILASFILDYVARQKVGGIHMTYGYLEQLAVLAPPAEGEDRFGSNSWLTDRGRWLQSPAAWLSSQRSTIRAEVDAAMFHLYGIERDDVDYIMETFPIVRRKDEAAHGEYRTKRLILEVYDLMADAMTTGGRYESPFDDVAVQGVTAEDVNMEGAAEQHPSNEVDRS